MKSVWATIRTPALGLWVVGLFCVAATAQNPVTYPVHGIVVNSLTQQPIARALVDGQADAVLTDSEGRFELNLPAGTTPIRVERPGFNRRAEESQHLVEVGANAPDLTFKLTPEAEIIGRVTLSSGDEADGIRFTAYRKTVTNGRPRWSMSRSAVTDTEGVFRLTDVDAPGEFVICSQTTHETHDRSENASGGRKSFGYPPVCAPGGWERVSDFSSLSPLAVSPGQQVEVDFNLTREQFYPVTIAMHPAQVKGVGIQIHGMSGRTTEYSTRWNASKGVAETSLPNGDYYAEALGGGPSGGRSNYGRADFRVAGQAVAGVNMALMPLNPVMVEVQRQTSGVGGNRQGANNEDSIRERVNDGVDIAQNAGLYLTLSPADATMADSGSGGLEPSRSSPGLFELTGVVPGRYWVQAFPYDGYISSITSGGVDLSRDPLVVGPGGTSSPIRVTLRDDGGQIQFTVNSSSTTSFAEGVGEKKFTFVYAIPLFSSTAQIPQMPIQGPGQFTIPNLRPGAYRVVALDRYIALDEHDSKALSNLSSQGKEVTVEANGIANVQLEVVHEDAAPGDVGQGGGR